MTGPALPDPDRLIRRSIANAAAIGMSRQAAALTVHDVAIRVINTLSGIMAQHPCDPVLTESWLNSLEESADQALEREGAR